MVFFCQFVNIIKKMAYLVKLNGKILAGLDGIAYVCCIKSVSYEESVCIGYGQGE